MVDRIRVATLNIWNRMGPWEERLVAIRKELARSEPDVIGLQEVSSCPSSRSIKRRRSRKVLVITSRSVVRRTPRRTRWATRPLEVADRAHVHVRFARHRRASLSRVRGDRFARRKIPFFSTHLNWKFDESLDAAAPSANDRALRRREPRAEGFPLRSSSAISTRSPTRTKFVSCAAWLARRTRARISTTCSAKSGTGAGITFSKEKFVRSAPSRARSSHRLHLGARRRRRFSRRASHARA